MNSTKLNKKQLKAKKFRSNDPEKKSQEAADAQPIVHEKPRKRDIESLEVKQEVSAKRSKGTRKFIVFIGYR